MALLQCSECAGMVSDKASLCPHCGAPLPQPLAADKPTTFKPAVQEEVGQPGVESVSNQAPNCSSGSHSAPVSRPGLVTSNSAVPGPVSGTNAISIQPQSLDTPSTVPFAVTKPKYIDPIFPSPESREDALKIVKDTSTGFFIYTVILAVVSFAFDFAFLIDAAIYACGGFALRRWNSRTAAVVLLLLALVSLGLNFVIKTSPWAWCVETYVVVGGIRAVYSTFMLHGRFAATANAVSTHN